MLTPDWLNEVSPALVAGACGGVIRTLSAPQKSMGKFASDVFVGAILAVYVGPIAGRILLPGFEFAEMDPDKAHSLGAFLAGFGGMVFVEIIDGVWRKRSERLAGKVEENGSGAEN